MLSVRSLYTEYADERGAAVKAAQDVVVRGAGGQAVHAARAHRAAARPRRCARSRGWSGRPPARSRSPGASSIRPAKGIFVAPNKRNFGMVFQSYAIWPHMNVFQNVGVPARGAQAAPRRRSATRSCACSQAVALDELVGPRRHQALRRPAAAAGARPRAGDGAAAPAARRAAVQSRRQAARPHALRAQAPAARTQPHHRLRHPRPERGARALARDRRDERGPRHPGRHAARDLRAAARPVRRRFRRHAPISSAAP